MKSNLRDNSNINVIVGLLIVGAAFLLTCGVFVYSRSDSTKLKKRIDLGNKYLGELEFNQAKTAFEEALEIDSDSTEAHEGYAEAVIRIQIVIVR